MLCRGAKMALESASKFYENITLETTTGVESLITELVRNTSTNGSNFLPDTNQMPTLDNESTTLERTIGETEMYINMVVMPIGIMLDLL